MSGMKNTANKATKLTSKVLYGPLAKYAPEVKGAYKINDIVDRNLSSPQADPGPAPPPLYGGIYQTGFPAQWGAMNAAAPTPATGKQGRLTPEQMDAALSQYTLGSPQSAPRGGIVPGSFIARLAALQGQGK
jgi:hypothetical protein